MTLDNKQIAFVGSGVMAEAMIKGILREQLVAPGQVIASGPRVERGRYLGETYGVRWTTDNRESARAADVVVLGVKPQAMPIVLGELSNLLKPDCLVISIAAGVRVGVLGDGLHHRTIVRAMPNTPGQIGAGITVWVGTSSVTEEQRAQTDQLLGALGETVHVEHESYLDMATALSGTGPAYILLFMEAMIDAGVHLGFPRRIAEQLVLQTMAGSVEYARQSGRHPATLRNEVTSPGGTSAEAIYHLEEGGLRTVVARSIWAAFRRSASLGGGEDGQSGGPDF